MAYNPPRKNQALTFAVGLADLSGQANLRVNPTIAAGDFKVDVDGAGFNNLATLPDVQPAGNVRVRIQLSAGEMNGDVISVRCVDATSPKEWGDLLVVILTSP